MGPVVAPIALLAVTCQKYVVPPDIAAGVYVLVVNPVAAGGGGLVVPKFTL